jgi:hypothetical protein
VVAAAAAGVGRKKKGITQSRRAAEELADFEAGSRSNAGAQSAIIL